MVGLLDRRRANKRRICLGLCSGVHAGTHGVALHGFSRRVDGRLGKIHIAEKIYRVYGLILQIKYLKKIENQIFIYCNAMLLYNNRSNFSILIESIKSEALNGLILFSDSVNHLNHFFSKQGICPLNFFLFPLEV